MAERPRTLTDDELAGIADLFDAITVHELARAWSELSFRDTGTTPEADTISDRIDRAIETFHLVAVPEETPPLLLAGPAAFPQLPEGATDLPHMLEVPDRPIDREAVAESVIAKIATELATDPPEDRAHALIELTYELEGWGSVTADDVRSAHDGR